MKPNHTWHSQLLMPGILMCVAVLTGTKTSAQKNNILQEGDVRAHWTDPSTGLMWTGRDNGSNISWSHAVKYCRDLNFAGYSGWRLPSINELEGIYDDSGFKTPHPEGVVPALAGKPKGGLLTTGVREWSSNRVLDDRGHNTGLAWEYDFSHGDRWKDPVGYSNQLRALCVRPS
jgi:Protein of unknown function (DUF1566)